MDNIFTEITKYSDDNDTDVLVFTGPITREGYQRFTEAIPETRKTKLLLVLSTLGGDPAAGYRIARAAGHYYGAENFSILIPGMCKSAGTLICIGSGRLIMADTSELGPLDVQVRKNDEIMTRSSGLDITRGMSYLQGKAMDSFRSFLIDLHAGGGISTKTAAKISSKLVSGLYSPIVAQFDPIRFGEMGAAMRIAKDYGSRLDSKSSALKEGALDKLISSYPDHGFVIDRSEARELFNTVDSPNNFEKNLAKHFENPENPLIFDLIKFLKLKEKENVPEQAIPNEGTTDIRLAKISPRPRNPKKKS